MYKGTGCLPVFNLFTDGCPALRMAPGTVRLLTEHFVEGRKGAPNPLWAEAFNEVMI